MTVKSKIIDYAVAIVFGLVILIVTNNLWLGIIGFFMWKLGTDEMNS